MRKLVILALGIGAAACSDASHQVNPRQATMTRPAPDLPERAPSAPGGAYSRTGFDDDPRIDPASTPFAPESEKGTLTTVKKDQVQLVDRNGDKVNLRITPHTRIERAGQRLGIEELSEGKQVRASYYYDGSDRFADHIELVAPDRDRR